jgi:hypothetical protein
MKGIISLERCFMDLAEETAGRVPVVPQLSCSPVRVRGIELIKSSGAAN